MTHLPNINDFPKKILVTGGMGFIGSYFINRLARHYDYIYDKTQIAGKELPSHRLEIINLDALTYAANKKNISTNSLFPAKYKFVKGNICNKRVVRKAMDGCDVVVNFAAESHVDNSIKNSSDFIKTNIDGTRVLLDEAMRQDVSRFIQISTDEVYGDLSLNQPDLKFHELSPLKPNNPYAASKASADLLALSYKRTHGLPLIITRCTNNYGMRQHKEKFIPASIIRALRDGYITVYGNGSNIRDWIHVKDHTEAIMQLMFRGCVGETYNIGANNEMSNLEIARKICEFTCLSDYHIDFVKDRKGHDLRYALNTNKIQKELNWSPIKYVTSFDDTLKEIIRFYMYTLNLKKRKL